jgi:hypothetical protein
MHQRWAKPDDIELEWLSENTYCDRSVQTNTNFPRYISEFRNHRIFLASPRLFLQELEVV